MATIDTRREQMFPKLTPVRLPGCDASAKSGVRCRGAAVQDRRAQPRHVRYQIRHCCRQPARRIGHVVPIIELGPGEFLAEVGQFSGRPSLVDGVAKTDVEAILVPTDGLRALLIAEAELGERIMRALILRRVALIERLLAAPC